MAATTIAVLSLKGGTGKTTTVRTLTDVLRRLDLDVLAVDLDPQGNLSDYFDVAADATPTVADVLSGKAKAKDAEHDGVMPASPILAEVERSLSGKMGRELVLRKALKDARKRHDVILIDCPPALGLLTVNGLVAADWALISSEAQYFALQGVEGALEVVEQAKEYYNDDLEWLGVVLNIADMRTTHSREAYDSLKEHYGEKVFDTMGMKLEKQQSDLFRHYILGLGTGDLIVKTSGATNEHFDLYNVLWINWKVQKIEEMLGKRKVMESR